MMKKKIRYKDRVLYVELYGELQWESTEALKKELLKALRGELEKIIIDLDAVPYIDSSGIGMLIDVQKRAAMKDVSVKLNRLRDSVKVVLEYTGFLNLFEHDNEQENLN